MKFLRDYLTFKENQNNNISDLHFITIGDKKFKVNSDSSMEPVDQSDDMETFKNFILGEYEISKRQLMDRNGDIMPNP